MGTRDTGIDNPTANIPQTFSQHNPLSPPVPSQMAPAMGPTPAFPFQTLPSSQTWTAGQQQSGTFPGSSVYSSFNRDGYQSSDIYSTISGRGGPMGKPEGTGPSQVYYPPVGTPGQGNQGLVSPYATLHLPSLSYSATTIGLTEQTNNPGSNPGRVMSPSRLSPTGMMQATPSAQRLSTLDHYSMSLFRTQLEQAQQQAQVWSWTDDLCSFLWFP